MPGQAPPWPAGIGNLSRETGVAFARAGRAPIETDIAFARVGRASDETTIAFARAGRAPIETAIAFAGEKWAFWVRFSLAEVMVVSMVAVWGRALVMVVSRWPASVVAEVSLVSTLSRHSCLCAKKFALLGLMVGMSAKKFAQRTKNNPQSAFYGVLGEFFRENTAGGVTPGEVFRGTAAERTVLGELFRGNAAGIPVPGESCRRQAALGSRRRPPTSRAPAQREPGKPATASCRRKTQTPRRRTMQNG